MIINWPKYLKNITWVHNLTANIFSGLNQRVCQLNLDWFYTNLLQLPYCPSRLKVSSQIRRVKLVKSTTILPNYKLTLHLNSDHWTSQREIKIWRRSGVKSYFRLVPLYKETNFLDSQTVCVLRITTHLIIPADASLLLCGLLWIVISEMAWRVQKNSGPRCYDFYS